MKTADEVGEELKETYHISLDLDDMLESLVLDGYISSKLHDCIDDIMKPLQNLRKCLTKELNNYNNTDSI